LIAPIDFLKIGEIVELLGEDSSKYKIVEKENNQNFYYKGDPVFAKCWNSEHPAYNLTESEKKVNCPLCPLSNALENYAKNAILKHLKMKKMSAYNSGLQCTEFNCKNTTKQRNLKNCNKFQCPGKMVSVYSLNQFFMELSNLERLVEKAYPGKNKFVRTLLDQCKFAVVKLSSFQANTAVDYRKLIEY
jgi:DNA Polymerase alpha zinc finger.